MLLSYSDKIICKKCVTEHNVQDLCLKNWSKTKEDCITEICFCGEEFQFSLHSTYDFDNEEEIVLGLYLFENY
jgi:hypothetical protein